MPNDNKPEQVESGKHAPDCGCDQCFTEFKTFCEAFNPTVEEQLEISESLKRDLFKRVLKYDSELQSLRQKLAEAQKQLMDLNNLCAEVSARAGVDRLAKVPDEIERLEKSAQQVKDLVPIVKRWEETCWELIKERDSLRADLAKNKTAREWIDEFGHKVLQEGRWVYPEMETKLRALVQSEEKK